MGEPNPRPQLPSGRLTGEGLDFYDLAGAAVQRQLRSEIRTSSAGIDLEGHGRSQRGGPYADTLPARGLGRGLSPQTVESVEAPNRGLAAGLACFTALAFLALTAPLGHRAARHLVATSGNADQTPMVLCQFQSRCRPGCGANCEPAVPVFHFPENPRTAVEPSPSTSPVQRFR